MHATIATVWSDDVAGPASHSKLSPSLSLGPQQYFAAIVVGYSDRFPGPCGPARYHVGLELSTAEVAVSWIASDSSFLHSSANRW